MTETDHHENHSKHGPTLAEVLAAVSEDQNFTGAQRANLRSSIRSFCRVLDRPPSAVAIEARTLRCLIAEAQPGAAGVKQARWRNITSELRRAIRLSGLSQQPPVDLPLSAAWEALLALAPDRWATSSLRVVARYCSERQIAPSDLTQEIFEGFEAWLAETRTYKDPHRSARVAARQWSRSAAAQPDRWPQVDLRARTLRDGYGLSWSALPPSLHEEVEAFHERSLNPDTFDPNAPRAVHRSTVRTRDGILRRMAGALVQRGIEPKALQSLSDLVHPDRLREALLFFQDRARGKVSEQMRCVTDLTLVIARHFCNLPDTEIAELEHLARRLRKGSRKPGLTDRNRERLRPFNDERLLRRLIHLPGDLLAEARRGAMTKRKALQIQSAVAIEILLFAPVRVSNLLALDRDRHFRRVRYKGHEELHLLLPAEEVKNDVDLEYPLPAEAVQLIDVYMERCQPLLADTPGSRLLFPGRAGQPKRSNGFGDQLRRLCRSRLGVDLNPHLFRHLAGFVHLSQHPGEYETVRRILGHKSIVTTTSAYTGLETLAAARHYDRTILSLREADGGSPARRTR